MPISKGDSWGKRAPFPPHLPVANSNAHLRSLVIDGATLVGLAGGDLFRTLGGDTAKGRLHSQEPDNLPVHFLVDVVDVTLDEERSELFVSHLVGHDAILSAVLTAMNVEFRGRLQLAPRAHPNDGLLDVYWAQLKPTDLYKIGLRARHGNHVPHPAILQSRSGNSTAELAKRVRVRADDVPIGMARRFEFRVRSDAITVVV